MALGGLARRAAGLVLPWAIREAQRWVKEHPEEIRAARQKAGSLARQAAQSQDVRGARLLLQARRESRHVSQVVKNPQDVFDVPALASVRAEYLRLIQRIRVARRMPDRLARDERYDVLESELNALRVRLIDVLGGQTPQLPETD